MSLDLKRLALHATWQVDALIEMLTRQADEDDIAMLLKAVLPRMHDLNNIAMELAGATCGETLADMTRTVFGCRVDEGSVPGTEARA